MTAIAPIFEDDAVTRFAAGPLSVLVVDDDKDASEELSEALEEVGFTCFAAASLAEAIQVAGDHPQITAIVTDFYLTGDDAVADNGIRLIDRLRETFPDRKFDCVVVSGDPEILAECAINGPVKFLAKPIVPESLTSMLLSPVDTKLPSGNGEVSLVLMHRLLESQSNVIATLTEALNATNTAHNKGATEALNRLDLLVDAARIANKRNSGSGPDDMKALLGYIAGQGSAVKALLRRKERPLQGA
ncbi:MAG: response regulator [Pseudomonadota bacterium]